MGGACFLQGCKPATPLTTPGRLTTPGVTPDSPYSTADYTYAEVDGNSLKIRVYRPDAMKDVKKTPCVISLQGSGFAGTDLSRGAGSAMWFIDHNYTVVAVPYRGYSEDIKFPAPLHEVVAAVRYLKKNADVIGIDPDRIASYGASSGGWYSLMLAVSGAESFSEAGLLGSVGDPSLQSFSSTLCCAYDEYGPTDFAKMDEQLLLPGAHTHNEDSPEARYMGFSPLQNNLTAVKRASPLSYLSKADTVPIFAAHGDADLNVPVGQSQALVEQLEALNITHEYHEIKGAPHAGDEFAQESHLQLALAFLSKECAR